MASPQAGGAVAAHTGPSWGRSGGVGARLAAAGIPVRVVVLAATGAGPQEPGSASHAGEGVHLAGCLGGAEEGGHRLGVEFVGLVVGAGHGAAPRVVFNGRWVTRGSDLY